MMMAQPNTRAVCAQENSIPCFEGEPQLEARFECPICLQCLKEPVLTSCGHRFCSDCIKLWLNQKGGHCPVDDRPISQETDLFPDNFTRREIQELENHGSHCSYQKDKESELQEEKEMECCYRDVGCMETFSRDQLATHNETQIHSHLSLLSAAYNKLSSSKQEHEIDAKAQEANNLWDPDAKGHTHNGESAQPWQSLIRSLYERIVMLEQRNREQDIQLENMKRQLSAISTAASAGVERLTQELSLRHCGGVYMWTIPQFSDKLTAMVATPTRCMYYSPAFYTAPTGYRFCARLNLSPKERDHLALLIHLKKSENDACLDWPFTGRISFMLVNSVCPHLHLRETMMSRPELDAFKRPFHDMNPRGFGYTEFISLQDLTSQGFISEDCLVIKIRVQSV